LETDNLESNPNGLAMYITALEAIGVDNLTPQAKKKLGSLA